jgi:subtilisin family serine protease
MTISSASFVCSVRGGGRRVAVVVAWLALVGGATACGGSGPDGAAFVPASDDPRQNVMVIDEGIDLSAADFRGKVAAAFTVECAPADADAGSDGVAGSDGGAADGGPPAFDDLKRSYIAELATPDTSCHLRDGISDKPDPLASVRRYRDRWNQMLRSQRWGQDFFTMQEWTELTAALDVEFGTFAYHGTATAGTVAHGNPGARLVLIERQLGTSDGLMQSFTCILQTEIDQAVALLSDAEVRDAWIHAPPSRYAQDLTDVGQRYSVGIINESFGQFPRAVLEQLQATSGCGPIDLSPYFTVLGGLDRASIEALGAGGPLRVQSAGNESAQVDSPTDALDCQPADPKHLFVGSYDLAQARSAFSNFGACVDVFAPGERVIVSYAGGWLLTAQGTSFAAPLVARRLSLTAPTPYDPVQARAALLAARTADGSIPLVLFPRDFFYAPGSPQLGALSAAGGAAARRPSPTGVDLRPTLLPLIRLRAAKRRR